MRLSCLSRCKVDEGAATWLHEDEDPNCRWYAWGVLTKIGSEWYLWAKVLDKYRGGNCLASALVLYRLSCIWGEVDHYSVRIGVCGVCTSRTQVRSAAKTRIITSELHEVC